jgi:hypothetical protein
MKHLIFLLPRGGIYDQKTSEFFVSHREKSITGCKWSLLKVTEGKHKRDHGGYRWNLEAERACFFSPGAFKTYSNLWEGRNQVISIQ